jgi:hypothetical protein
MLNYNSLPRSIHPTKKIDIFGIPQRFLATSVTTALHVLNFTHIHTFVLTYSVKLGLQRDITRCAIFICSFSVSHRARLISSLCPLPS